MRKTQYRKAAVDRCIHQTRQYGRLGGHDLELTGHRIRRWLSAIYEQAGRPQGRRRDLRIDLAINTLNDVWWRTSAAAAGRMEMLQAAMRIQPAASR